MANFGHIGQFEKITKKHKNRGIQWYWVFRKLKLKASSNVKRSFKRYSF